MPSQALKISLNSLDFFSKIKWQGFEVWPATIIFLSNNQFLCCDCRSRSYKLLQGQWQAAWWSTNMSSTWLVSWGRLLLFEWKCTFKELKKTGIDALHYWFVILLSRPPFPSCYSYKTGAFSSTVFNCMLSRTPLELYHFIHLSCNWRLIIYRKNRTNSVSFKSRASGKFSGC